MFKRVTQMLSVSFLSSIMTVSFMSNMYVPKAEYDELLAKVENIQQVETIEVDYIEEPVVEPMVMIDVPEEPIVVIEEPEYSLTQEEIDLIALVVMAEAEGECEEGKRLVIDTILNRVDGKYWPDTVSEVIYQPHQFTSMWNGRADRCYVKEDIVELVKEELVSRYNYDCVFFRTTRYSDYGVPMFQVGSHYFSSYN